jgi:hypothetical protein
MDAASRESAHSHSCPSDLNAAVPFNPAIRRQANVIGLIGECNEKTYYICYQPGHDIGFFSERFQRASLLRRRILLQELQGLLQETSEVKSTGLEGGL